jgi:drug/metabolite transporter (DMT)-like permease
VTETNATTRRARRLAAAIGLLALLQALHGLDDLRTDKSAGVRDALLNPAALLGIGLAVAAITLLARGHAWGRRLAAADALLVGVGFIVVHGVPVEAGPAVPYWGEGSADAVQWLGVTAILLCCVWILALASDRWHAGATTERAR